VTTVSAGSVVTLTATVMAGSTPVTVGQVNFCVGSAPSCTDIHLLATAQLTSAGAAVFKFRPGAGSHSYKAVFLETPHGAMNYAGSASGAAALTVTATIRPSVTQLVEASTHDNPNAPYPLTLTVGGTGSAPPTGTVSFLNSSDNNAVIGAAALTSGQSQLSLLNSLNAAPSGLDFQAQAVVTGDFNGDGIPDVAAVSYGEIGVFLGDGNGGFTVKTYAGPNGTYYSGLAAGDFNGDGILDLATTNINNTLVVLLGNGDGTFTPVANPPSEPGTNTIATADFNQDGILDLALVDGNSKTVILLLGNGDGTFTATQASPVTGLQPRGIATGDFNGDGIPDLVVLNFGSTVTDVQSSLTVLLGNGDCTFQQPTTSVATGGVGAEALVAADFNGDGALDLALIEETDSNAVAYSIAVLLGDGHGGFGIPSLTLLAGTPAQTVEAESMTVADFNQDGIPDLAVIDYVPGGNTGTVSEIPGNADGTFSTSTQAASVVVNGETGPFTIELAAADFNGDGYPDLVWGNDYGLPVFITATQIASATISTPLTLPPGSATDTILANYPGDTNYAPSTAIPFTLTEVPYTPTVTVTPSSPSIAPSQVLTVAIAVSGGAGNPAPTGSVSLISQVYGSTDYASESFPLSDGAASITIPAGSLIPGPNTITVSYAGDNNYDRTTGTASVTVVGSDFALSNTPVTITPAGTGGSSTITVTPANGFTGTVALTCAVTATPKITGVLPTCSIASSVTITGTSPMTATLNIGTQLNTVSGSYTVTVTGTSGDITPSTNVSVTIASPPGTVIPTVTVTPSPASIADNQPDTVTVTVAGVSGSATPTGLVAVYTIDNTSYYAQQTLSSGSASFTIPAGTLSTGANAIEAIYSGDANYVSEGGSTTITIYDLDVSSSAPAAVSPGATATATVTLNAGNGFGGTWNMTCALTQGPSGAQSPPTCKLSPTNLQLTDGVNTTTTMSVTTTAESTTSDLVRLDTWPGSWRAGGSIALAGLLLVGFRRKRRLLLVIVLSFAAGILATGCGGGGSSSSPPPHVTTTPATTAGSYVFTVTGTDSDKANTAVSVNVTVTVQ
jgi:trimeric autotransporter adhesin